MYDANIINVTRIQRMSVPRIRLENFSETTDRDRFKLTLRVRDIKLNNDGSLHVWLDRGDVSNLHLDCSASLLDDDIAHGVASVE